jgi:hypothetical protein
MQRLTHSATALLLDLSEEKGPAVMGSWFQDAVATALRTFTLYSQCYANPGAGQPDILSGTTGFEVKSIAEGHITLAGNYADIQQHFREFRLVALRTDIQPFPVWVLEITGQTPQRIHLREQVDLTALGCSLETDLARRLSELITATGTGWTRARNRDEAKVRLTEAAKNLTQIEA